jgi:hypothetical protein
MRTRQEKLNKERKRYFVRKKNEKKNYAKASSKFKIVQ